MQKNNDNLFDDDLFEDELFEEADNAPEDLETPEAIINAHNENKSKSDMFDEDDDYDELDEGFEYEPTPPVIHNHNTTHKTNTPAQTINETKRPHKYISYYEDEDTRTTGEYSLEGKETIPISKKPIDDQYSWNRLNNKIVEPTPPKQKITKDKNYNKKQPTPKVELSDEPVSIKIPIPYSEEFLIKYPSLRSNSITKAIKDDIEIKAILDPMFSPSDDDLKWAESFVQYQKAQNLKRQSKTQEENELNAINKKIKFTKESQEKMAYEVAPGISLDSMFKKTTNKIKENTVERTASSNNRRKTIINKAKKALEKIKEEEKASNIYSMNNLTNEIVSLNPNLQKFKLQYKAFEPEYRQGKIEVSPAEIIISNNLGLTNNQICKLMRPGSALTKKDKRELLGSGVAKQSLTNAEGEVLDITYIDYDILHYLSKFKVCTSSILKNIHGYSLDKTIGILERMKVSGLVMDFVYPGLGVLWGLTKTGASFTDYPEIYMTQARLPSTTGIPPLLCANFVASYLWNNRLNVINIKDFPYKGKLVNNTLQYGEDLVSETQIRKSFNKARVDPDTGLIEKAKFPGEYVQNARIKRQGLYTNYIRDINKNKPPETIQGNEFCFVLMPNDSRCRFSHNPDLVIRRPRVNGKPMSIAIEVERKDAPLNSYIETLLAYKLDNNFIAKVVWICSNRSVAQRISDAAKEVKLDRSQIDIIPFIGDKGPMMLKDPWML